MPVNKVRRRGSYAPLSAHYYKDDRLIRAGERAELLYVRGLAFCADVINDGFITDAQLAHVSVGLSGVKARVKALVEVGAWERGAGGYRVVAWLSWNKSRQDILNDNRKDADRKGLQGSDQPLPPEPPPDELPDSDPWDGALAATSPSGFRTESATTPHGIRTGSHARGPAPAPSKPEPEPELPLPTGGGAGEPEAVGADAADDDATPPTLQSVLPSAQDSSGFEEFWTAWPRKIAKSEARKAFAKAVKRGSDPTAIAHAAAAHARQWEREGKEVQYVPHATTWLNQGRYDDPIEEPHQRLAVSGDNPWGRYGMSESPWAQGRR